MTKRNSQAMRNLKSAGWQAAKFTGRTTDKAAVGLFRWAATDHSGMGRALNNMPSMGFLDTLKYILMQFLMVVVGSVISGVLMFLLIAFGIPFLITGSF